MHTNMCAVYEVCLMRETLSGVDVVHIYLYYIVKAIEVSASLTVQQSHSYIYITFRTILCTKLINHTAIHTHTFANTKSTMMTMNEWQSLKICRKNHFKRIIAFLQHLKVIESTSLNVKCVGWCFRKSHIIDWNYMTRNVVHGHISKHAAYKLSIHIKMPRSIIIKAKKEQKKL